MDLPDMSWKYTKKSIRKVFADAILGLLAPVIIIVGVLSGFATVTEVSMLACFYVVLVGFFIYRTLSGKMFFEGLCKSTLFASTIMALFGIVGIFTWFIAVEKVAANLSAYIVGMNLSPVIFLLFVNIFLLFIGMIMDAIPAMTIFMPVMMPIAMGLGIDPTHFGIVVVVNLMLGLLTPPVGGLLYVEQKISGVSFNRLSMSVLPFVGAMIFVLLIITYIPELVTVLPNMIFGRG
jgi:tripartite ATP-independent transporter DctM subunit